MDVLSPEQRRFNMSRIKGVDTSPEMLVRKLLWAEGFRYRLHRKDLPGKPDIVLPGYMAVIFVHGCFWHRHGCSLTTTPATNAAFWRSKFKENVARDKRDIALLRTDGWRVAVVWECMLKGRGNMVSAVVAKIAAWLDSDLSECSFCD